MGFKTMPIHNIDKIIAETYQQIPGKELFEIFLHKMLYYKSQKDVKFCIHLSPPTYN